MSDTDPSSSTTYSVDESSPSPHSPIRPSTLGWSEQSATREMLLARSAAADDGCSAAAAATCTMAARRRPRRFTVPRMTEPKEPLPTTSPESWRKFLGICHTLSLSESSAGDGCRLSLSLLPCDSTSCGGSVWCSVSSCASCCLHPLASPMPMPPAPPLLLIFRSRSWKNRR